jgi:hypothetical protein
MSLIGRIRNFFYEAPFAIPVLLAALVVAAQALTLGIRDDSMDTIDTDLAEVITCELTPVESVTVGEYYAYRGKRGGESNLLTVRATSAPYPITFSDGRVVQYVNVSGLGKRKKAVQLKKLLQNRKKCSAEEAPLAELEAEKHAKTGKNAPAASGSTAAREEGA